MVDWRMVGKLVVLAAARQGFTLSELKESLLLDDGEIEAIARELKTRGLLVSVHTLILTAQGQAAASEALRKLEELVARALARDEDAVEALAPYLAVLPYIILGDQELDPSEIIIGYLDNARKKAS